MQVPCGRTYIGLRSWSLSVAKTVDIAPVKQVCVLLFLTLRRFYVAFASFKTKTIESRMHVENSGCSPLDKKSLTGSMNIPASLKMKEEDLPIDSHRPS